LQLISQGVGVAAEIQALAKRVQAGEEITEAEIELARARLALSVAGWNKAAGVTTETNTEGAAPPT
jgi:hypothetical protein